MLACQQTCKQKQFFLNSVSISPIDVWPLCDLKLSFHDDSNGLLLLAFGACIGHVRLLPVLLRGSWVTATF
jgi:hypothetical protein